MDKLKEIWQILKTVYVAQVEVKAGDLLLSALILVALSVTFGLVVLGWLVMPVQWDYSEIQVEAPEPISCPQYTNMNGIEYTSKAVYVRLLSEWNAFRPENEYFPLYLSQLDDIDLVACNLVENTNDIGEIRRYIKVAYEKNGYGCK